MYCVFLTNYSKRDLTVLSLIILQIFKSVNFWFMKWKSDVLNLGSLKGCVCCSVIIFQILCVCGVSYYSREVFLSIFQKCLRHSGQKCCEVNIIHKWNSFSLTMSPASTLLPITLVGKYQNNHSSNFGMKDSFLSVKIWKMVLSC